MADQSSIAGNTNPVPPNTFNPIVIGSNLKPGSACKLLGGGVQGAQANSLAGAQVVGLMVGVGVAGERAYCKNNGPLKLTAAEFDAIAGTTGGLAEGVPYYLSAATAGHITSTKPSNPNYVQPIGVGMAADEIFIYPGAFPIVGSGG